MHNDLLRAVQLNTEADATHLNHINKLTVKIPHVVKQF